jgi:hypothetical protein
MDQVVSRQLQTSSKADKVVFYLGRLAVEDFVEIPADERDRRVELWKTRDDEFGRAALRGIQAGAAD